MTTIVITGAGPAGVITAVGLKRLGYNVCLLGRPRRFASVEGVSARVLQALAQQQLHHTVASIEEPGVRQVSWNGVQHAQNHEWLVDRSKFDRALWKDAQALGVPVQVAGVTKVSEHGSGWRIDVDTGATVEADFWVEARGRSAPRAAESLRGPETISILNRWTHNAATNATAIRSDPKGWVWGARLSRLGYWQYTLDTAEVLPAKHELLDFCRAKQKHCDVFHSLFAEDELRAVDVHVRAGTSILNNSACGDNWLRVGDAAMAVDSLSGNGIFQSMSSALQAPSVINTLLKAKSSAQLAKDFHNQRVEHLFYRFARMGREFYAEETRYADEVFWHQRQQWPDTQESHQMATPIAEIAVRKKAVIEDFFIREQEVVVTPDQPLGIWHVDGIALAPLFKRWLAEESWDSILATHTPQEQASLLVWLAAQGLR
ncbi:MAG TPA: tryptophan 7-halogenase [Alcanivoracaceae bacterium]|nr:tryptophan 7-halogenase [Alcanivoracaceae bacterium]